MSRPNSPSAPSPTDYETRLRQAEEKISKHTTALSGLDILWDTQEEQWMDSILKGQRGREEQLKDEMCITAVRRNEERAALKKAGEELEEIQKEVASSSKNFLG